MELNSVFQIPLPGAKMIWQFGELGYDYSINTCEDGSTIHDDCRTNPKPIRWDYLNNSDRSDLFQVMAKLNHLKQSYDEFVPETYSYDLKSEIKWYSLTHSGKHVFTIGNFSTQEKTKNFSFPETGKYYEFFTRDSIEINSSSQNVTLNPGEYRMYSTQNFDFPHVVTKINEVSSVNETIKIYPNPASKEINIAAQQIVSGVQIYSLRGKLLFQTNSIFENTKTISIEGYNPGVYILRAIQEDKVSTKKFVVK